MDYRAVYNTFQPFNVMVDCMKNPQLPKKWAVADFHDKKLCARVLKAFRKAQMEPADFEEAIHSAREQVYQASRNAFLQVIGIPYSQWMAMELACHLLEIEGFGFGSAKPYHIEGPADYAYTTMWLKKVEKKDLRIDLEGLSLDHWCLYKEDANAAAAPATTNSKQPVAKAAAAPAADAEAVENAQPVANAAGSATNAQPVVKAAENKQQPAAVAPAFVQRAPAANSLGRGGLAGSQWARKSSRFPPPVTPSPPPEVPRGGLVKSSWGPAGSRREEAKGKGKSE